MPLPEEYLEYLEKNTTALERVGDRFTTVDQRINYLVRQMSKLGVRDKEFAQTTQVRFQQTMAPLTGNIFTEDSPWPAICTSVMIHFPPGCNALVDVAVGHGDVQFCPQTGFIALDAATPVFPTYESIGSGRPIWVEIQNTDNTFPHTVSVVATLQRTQA